MHDRFVDKWANNVKMWRKQRLPIQEVVERLNVLPDEEREAVRERVFSPKESNDKEVVKNEQAH